LAAGPYYRLLVLGGPPTEVAELAAAAVAAAALAAAPAVARDGSSPQISRPQQTGAH
jgi:hypothetical protein